MDIYTYENIRNNFILIITVAYKKKPYQKINQNKNENSASFLYVDY